MSRRLLDTDILSEIIKGKNAAVAARAATYLAEQARFTTSAITVAEIV
jgi:tRNA(fMet)-specific endonuclease VapC